MQGIVVAVSSNPDHTFSKYNQKSVTLLKGLGIEGDAHCGQKVQHLSRVKANPDQPNLRQVHLVHSELFEELMNEGFTIKPGDIGENITTKGIALLELPRGTLLYLGESAVVEITGLRNPCQQLNKYRDGLMEACIERNDEGNIAKRKGGIMSVVREGGIVKPMDIIRVEVPKEPHTPLAVV